ncbi:MAG: metal ABC transporter permease [Candidatus Hydrogenedentes bacterium]|nr:metal ABC transporter permease [Candidatus Hydrogenedentota bacterium]
MLEVLGMPFMQRALLGALMVAYLANFFGPLVVQRRMAFLGSGLAHAAFGGVALGVLLHLEPLWTALPFTVLVSIGITAIQHNSTLQSDTIIGIFFSAAMALGIVFLYQSDAYSRDAFSYLFGSILAIQPADLWVALAVCVGSLALWPFWGSWAYATFDRNLAVVDRVSVRLHDYVLQACLALTIVVCMKLVGIILFSAFLVLPAATARVFARSFAGMTVMAMILGFATTIVGLLASHPLSLPSGPAIILLQTGIFFLSLAARMLIRRH